MGESVRELINIVEAFEAHLPRKFWYNAKGDQFFSVGTHSDDVLSNWEEMGLPEASIREITGSTGVDPTEIAPDPDDHNDDDYEDEFLNQNEGHLLLLAMRFGWVRGGYESVAYGPFLQGDDLSTVRKAAKYICEMYPQAVQNGIIIGTFDDGVHLQPNEIEAFIRRGILPTT